MNGELEPARWDVLRQPLDPLLSDPVRFRIQAALQGLPPGAALSFTALRKLLQLTDGNLGMHLRVLVEAGYAQPSTAWQGRRRRTLYSPTETGRAAFASHVQALEGIIHAGRSGRLRSAPA